MAEQAITQEQLFLPLLQFIADHGGVIEREADHLLEDLADRLGLSAEERTRQTGGRRHQWRSTVEWSREKLIEIYDALERGERGVWSLSEEGWRLLRDPPAKWIEEYEAWKKERSDSRPADSEPPPERPSGSFRTRLEQIQETLEHTVVETLRLARNQALARAIKEEYDYECQMCDPAQPQCPKIPTAEGRSYVEAHHIEGLPEVAARAEHGQLDESEYVNLTSYHNVLVVCPYHHMLIHHHEPPLQFDEEHLVFRADDGSVEIPILVRHEPHLRPHNE